MDMEGRSESNHNAVIGDGELMKREQVVTGKLLHLENNERAKPYEFLSGKDISKWSLHDHRSAKVPAENGFELKGENHLPPSKGVVTKT